MELRLRPNLPLLILLFLLSSATTALGASHPPSPSPTATPTPKPKSQPPPSHIGGSPSPVRSTLDPKQLSALQSMNLPTTDDPCSLPPPHNFTSCDSSTPFRHVVGLTLANCSTGLDFSATALRALSTSLVSFSFIRCPIPLFPMPSSLISNLHSFSVVSSFQKLTGVYLSRLINLTELVVTDVPIHASGIAIVLSEMENLRSVEISRTKIPGGLPHNWNCRKVKKIDLSSNGLDGSILPSIGTLKELEFLNLSSNAFTGALPQTLANLASLKIASFSHNSLTGPLPDLLTKLPRLEHLDVSYNQINGTVPKFLTKIKGLKHLNLAYNNFHGVLPFDASFIKKLDVIKLGGNSNLCYNHTVLSSKLKLGIARCDKYGMPVSPPADRNVSSSSSDDITDDSETKKSGGGHHGPNKTVLAVAIGLACLVFLVIFIVCLSKMCR